MEVKLVARTLGIFELYAREVRPLSLTELSRGLNAPMSSTLALVRTLIGKGYLYETRKRGGYYPTKKLLGASLKIDSGDPVLDLIHPHLIALRDASGETTVLGKRQDLSVIYLDAVQSTKAIRYMAEVGETRSLHSNSIGKALFSALDSAEQRKLAARIKWERHTGETLTSAKALLADATQSAARGWTANIGESVADLAAIAMPFCLAGEWYGLSIVGPISRMQASWDNHIVLLKRSLDELHAALRSHEGLSDGSSRYCLTSPCGPTSARTSARS